MTDSIPNQFHFVFGLRKQKRPFHLCYYLCIESCYQVNRPDKIYFYYHHQPYGKYWELAKKRIIPERVGLNRFVSLYKYGFKNRHCRKYRYAHHSDFIRLEKLIERGGVYADIDTIFVKRIPTILFSMPFVLGREDNVYCFRAKQFRPSLCNAFIMSEKGSEFARIWLERMKREFDGSWSEHSTFLPQTLSELFPTLIHVEPSRSFYKHMWTKEGIRTLLEEGDKDYEGVFNMHLWSHLWWSKKRQDFSNFCEEKLTEEYIREIDTTYNLVARRFLP